MNTGMKQGRVKSSSRMNLQSSSLHKENGRFVSLLEHDLKTAIWLFYCSTLNKQTEIQTE